MCCSWLPLQGYMMKKGHKRKNWTERWFMLKPNVISYYIHEDLAEHKGDILLDGHCTVEVSFRENNLQVGPTVIQVFSPKLEVPNIRYAVLWTERIPTSG